MGFIIRDSISKALALSVALHLLVFGTWEAGRHFEWFRETFLPKWLVSKIVPESKIAKTPADEERRLPDIPLVFVDVDPAQASAEAPPEAKFYSARNARAANPDPQRNLDVPKIEGTQNKVIQTVDREKPQVEAPPKPEPAAPEQPRPMPLQPSLAKPPAETEPAKPEPKPVQERNEPKPAIQPGDLMIAKAPPREDPPEAAKPAASAHVRPRRLAQVAPGLAGQKMQQDGGVRRPGLESSFDVKATEFGSYDAAIVAAIQQRWYDLLEQRETERGYAGKVVLIFRLHSDGKIKDLRVEENEVTEMLGLFCVRAVEDNSPYAPWPSDMRRMVGRSYREVRFTFYYN